MRFKRQLKSWDFFVDSDFGLGLVNLSKSKFGIFKISTWAPFFYL